MVYFDVEVFVDHIKLFSDFTIIPFFYGRSDQKYEVRTNLRTIIPLENPLKPIVIKDESEKSTDIDITSRVITSRLIESILPQ